MVNSKQKGKRGELEFSKKIRELFDLNCRRTNQYCGQSENSSDVVSDLRCHFEVKRVNALNLSKAFEQAKRDASHSQKIPVVAHRKDNEEWLITMSLEDLKKFVLLNYYVFKDK